MPSSNGQGLTQIDYDLHGVVGIRVIDATPDDARAVARQLGPIQAPLSYEPDIVIRFVEKFSAGSPLVYLGVDDAAFTDDAFLILRSKHKARARVRIPFERIGHKCEIVCERGLPAVPMLIPILNLTALNKGELPMHASAFTYNGTGVLVTGWSKGGKTETLLAFMIHGADYIGDEWVYISSDGQYMNGIPEPIRVWDWHLKDLPKYKALVGRGNRARLQGLTLMVDSMNKVISSGIGQGTVPMRLIERMSPLMKRQLFVDMPPEKLFGQTLGTFRGTLDTIIFAASHELDKVQIRAIDAQEIAERMVFSLQEERKEFMSYYRKFRFAFPHLQNPLIEEAEERQCQTLQNILAGKEAFAVFHPYPADIPALFEALSVLL